jgi:peptidoglycan hydrolase-like protein with peptidoglycan-binding domain
VDYRQDGAADTAPPGKLPAKLRVAPAGKRTGEVDEEAFRQAISLQLEARFAEGARPVGAGSGSQAQQSIGSPLGRQVNQEEHVSRRPWFTLMLGLALGVTSSAAGIYAFQRMNPLPTPPHVEMATPPEPNPSPMPAESPAPPVPPAAVDPAPVVQALPVATAPVMSNLPVPTTRTPDENELSYSEVLELQTLLESLGMRPGFLDGIPGPRTAAAIRRYEESRGQPQTGNLDRELLKRLRQEPK